MKRLIVFSSTVLLLLIGFVACQQMGQSAQPPAQPTEVAAEPTPTLLPTERPTERPTGVPTITPVPTETPLMEAWMEGILSAMAADGTVTVHFSQPMAADSTNTPLRIEPYVNGAFMWNDDFTAVTFTPTERYARDEYTVSVSRSLASTDGQAFSPPPRWTFQIAIGPRVIGQRPTNNTIFDLNQTLRLTFNNEMDHASVAEALQIEPPLAYELEWSDKNLTIVPQEPFMPGQAYEITVEKTARSFAGFPLEEEMTWRLLTQTVISAYKSPTNDARDQPIEIAFRYGVDGEAAIDTFQIDPPLAGTLEWNGGRERLIFEPTEPFALNTLYTISFDQLQTRDGHVFQAPEPISFGPYSPIILTRPQGNRVNPLDFIEVVFDRPLDEASAKGAFTIEPAVDGELTYSETTLTFKPEGRSFAANTEYTVTIDTSVRSADGESLLNDPYIFTFGTGVAQTMANFGWGANAQVLDASGRRAIQFVSEQNRTGIPIWFELYEMDTTQLLDQYSANFRGMFGYEKTPLDIDALPMVYEWRMETAEGQQEYTNVQELIVPDEVPAGLYVLNIDTGVVNDQMIVAVTDNTLMVKKAEGQLVSWLTDIHGDPRPDVEVGVYSRDGEQIGSGVTNEMGVFEIDLGLQDPTPLIVVAQDGEDVTFTGLSFEWQSAGTGGWWQPARTSVDYAAHVYTDRPIYKPGQLVYYKAILRNDDDALLDMPAEGTEVTVRIRDARNNVVRTETKTTNSFGTIIGEFQLAEGAMLGEYSVELSVVATAERRAFVKSQAFKVEDYRKPDYAVEVTVDQERLILEGEIEVTIQATYFYGEPVANAQVRINHFVLGEVYSWYDVEQEYIWYESYVDGQTLQTDENGRVTFIHTAEQDWRVERLNWRTNVERSIWAIEAAVDDGSNQAVSGFSMYEVYNRDTKIKLDTNGYFKKPGDSFSLTAEAVDLYDRPLANQSLTVRFLRYRSGEGYDDVVKTAELTTGANGRATTSTSVEEAGYYRVELVHQNAKGWETTYRSWLYVFDRDFSYWYGSQSGNLSIQPEKDSYAPGETARLVVESSVSGPALLTFERGTVRREQLVELTAPVTVLDVPIIETDAPNIFVSINVYEPQTREVDENTWNSLPDGYLRTATAEISVPVTDKTLIVTITPDKDDYKPREEATFTVQVTNQQGVPVSAEVSLAMVDEALFSLSNDLSEPIFESFYYDRDNIVTTYNSLEPTRELWGGGMGGGGGDGGVAGNPRSDFPDTAAWFPRLQTDANGEAQVTLTLPDNLTTWRLTGKATTADTQVGESITKFIVSKDVIVRPLLPRTLTAGDTILLSAMVQNYSDLALTFDVSMMAVDADTGDEVLVFDNDIMQTVTLQPGESRIVGWSAFAPEASNALVTVSAVFQDQLLDGVQLPLVIRPLAVPDVTTQIGQFQGTQAISLDMPNDALPMSTVKIELSRSIAGTLLEGLDYLTGFPYGCVEQTMSKALPNAVVGRAFNQLGVGNPTLQADLPAKIDAGVQRLYGYQHTDGGWGWWYDDESDHYQTAWVLFGLINTAEAGYEIDPAVIARGAHYLRQELSSMDVKTRSYALYSMALAVEFIGDEPSGDEDALTADLVLSQLNTLASNQAGDEFDPFSRASLALAYWELGAAAEANMMLDTLALDPMAEVDNVTGQVTFGIGTTDGYYKRKTMASDLRTTAHVLSAFSRIRPGTETEAGMVRYLMANRQQQGWGTTNETSFAIIGLTDHLLATSFNEGAAETTYTVLLNGDAIAEGTLGQGEPAVSLELPAELFSAGTNDLRIEQGGAGQLYYAVKQEVFVAQEEIAAAGVIDIERTYLTANNQPLDPTELKPGDLVKVRLKVTVPETLSYVIVEDQIPGGLEALNERLNTTTHVGTAYEYQEPYYYWREYGYNHKEVYGDRVSFFITEMGAGTRTLEYMTRVTHAGSFVAMSAEAYAMYDLAQWGRSASAVLEIPAE